MTAPSSESATVQDGAGTEDISYQAVTDTVSASWHGFIDYQSGIHSYSWCLVDGHSGREIECKDKIFTVSLRRHQLKQSLLHGKTYYIAIKLLTISKVFFSSMDGPNYLFYRSILQKQSESNGCCRTLVTSGLE